MPSFVEQVGIHGFKKTIKHDYQSFQHLISYHKRRIDYLCTTQISLSILYELIIINEKCIKKYEEKTERLKQIIFT